MVDDPAIDLAVTAMADKRPAIAMFKLTGATRVRRQLYVRTLRMYQALSPVQRSTLKLWLEQVDDAGYAPVVPA